MKIVFGLRDGKTANLVHWLISVSKQECELRKIPLEEARVARTERSTFFQ